ncbi:MAG: porin family protein [Calditrichota bacterium]
MKRPVFILTAIIALLFSGNAFAQLGINPGIKGGITISTFSFSDDVLDDIVSNRTGFLGGVFLEIDPLGPLGFQIEGLFIQKGTVTDSSAIIMEPETDFNFTYIDVPVLVKLQLSTPVPATPSVYAGPVFGFNLKAEAEANGETRDVDDVKSTDVGMAFGVDLALGAAGTKFIIDLRYMRGLTSITDGDGSDTKNNTFAAMLGVSF